jgi:hypothetical protein
VEEMAVSMGHDLVALFGCRVEAHRIIGAVLLSKRDAVVRSVDRAGRGKDEMAAGASSNTFEYVDEPHEIAGDIFIGTGD